MRISLTTIMLTLACTSRPLAQDDEAGTTTNPGTTDDDTTTSESTTTGTGTDESLNFIPSEDIPYLATCDIYAQDCPEGEKCVPYALRDGYLGALKCVPVLGEQAPGEPCTWGGLVEATDDCDATSICWDAQRVDGQLVGTCIVQCTGAADAPQCPPAASCFVDGNGSIVICLPDCDPLTQDCDEGDGCYWANMQFSCMAMTENIPTGGACGYVNDCAPGNLCTDAAALPSCADAACCTSFCVWFPNFRPPRAPERNRKMFAEMTLCE